MKKTELHDLFILDMANNHQGSVTHGLAIIQDMADVARLTKAKAAIKFQYRDLDTFIHPLFRDSTTNKHIPRFLSTKLEPDQFKTLVDSAKSQGLLTACTPFDERSVERIVEHGFDILKIASCSVKDKPLLNKIAEVDLPIVCSTAGADFKDIDYAVELFTKKGRDLALMHCVAIYPTPKNMHELNQIDELKRRYPQIPIGYSTHEDPNDMLPVRIAVAKGATILERHVGKVTDKITLNAYSSVAEQVQKWIEAASETKQYCGTDGESKHSKTELDSLESLMRGVYVSHDISQGHPFKKSDVFYAMPLQEGQIHSGDFREGMIADKEYKKYDPVTK